MSSSYLYKNLYSTCIYCKVPATSCTYYIYIHFQQLKLELFDNKYKFIKNDPSEFSVKKHVPIKLSIQYVDTHAIIEVTIIGIINFNIHVQMLTPIYVIYNYS
jgi:hypothetical protein